MLTLVVSQVVLDATHKTYPLLLNEVHVGIGIVDQCYGFQVND